MMLKELRIARNASYGDNPKGFHGKAVFEGDRGEVALVLNAHHIEQIFSTCADSIEEVAKAAARFLHIEIQNQRALVSPEAAAKHGRAVTTKGAACS